MEEDHGHPDREDELRANAVQGVLDDAERRRPDQSAHGHQHDHLRYPQERREELRDQSSAQYESEVEEDVFYFQDFLLSGVGRNGDTPRYSSLAERSSCMILAEGYWHGDDHLSQ